MDDIKKIYDKFLDAHCSEEELRILLEHFRKHGTESELIHKIEQILTNYEEVDIISLKERDGISRNRTVILNRIRDAEARGKSAIKWWRYAAAILLFIFGVWQYKSHWQASPTEDRLPATTLATLTLSNGKQIRLDTSSMERVYEDGGVSISHSGDGAIVYRLDEYVDENASGWNSISTPLGGTYKVILPDSTQVWLNAGSTLTYPVRFAGQNRTVKLLGEAFFDVKHDVKRPFIVSMEEEFVKVLGTSFNVSAYAGESSVTTLEDGKVELVRDGNRQFLMPDEQATWLNGKYVVNKVNTQQFTSWKDGWFIFHDVRLDEILRQLSKWYNVEVDLKDLPDDSYYAEIGRNVPLSQVLEMIESNGKAKLKLERGKIVMD